MKTGKVLLVLVSILVAGVLTCEFAPKINKSCPIIEFFEQSDSTTDYNESILIDSIEVNDEIVTSVEVYEYLIGLSSDNDTIHFNYYYETPRIENGEEVGMYIHFISKNLYESMMVEEYYSEIYSSPKHHSYTYYKDYKGKRYYLGILLCPSGGLLKKKEIESSSL